MDIKHPLINIHLHSKTLIVNSDKNKLIFPRVTKLKDAALGGGHTSTYWWTGSVGPDS